MRTLVWVLAGGCIACAALMWLAEWLAMRSK